MKENDINSTNDYELIMLYQENNEDAKNIIFMKYKFIIDILMRKYKKYIDDLNIDIDEVYSECTVGFSDALKNYKDDKNASLPTFITLCVERKIGALLKKYSREKYKIWHETYSLDFTYEDDLRLMDIIKDDEHDPLKNITDKERYDELIKDIEESLTTNEYEVFTLLIRGLNYKEIAKILNKDPKQIDNAIQRLKNKIKKII